MILMIAILTFIGGLMENDVTSISDIIKCLKGEK